MKARPLYKPEIKYEGEHVVVTECEGKEAYRAEATAENIQIAHYVLATGGKLK